MKAREVNFDGLIGPTHHFAGLAFGNVASMTNQGRISSPKKAALQGLRKMRLLHDLGLKQGVIPPVHRPDFEVLKNLGFTGSREQMLKGLSRQPQQLISAFFSASSMWTANSSTVSPSADTPDRKVHLTPANLTSKFHRALEPHGTTAILHAIFSDPARFIVHDPLVANAAFGDEGAANHTRFCAEQGKPGLELFIYGKKAFPSTGENASEPRRFPARQSLEASSAVARLHGLSEDRTVFWQQNPEAIDAGAFHNDVVSVGNADLFFYHEDAFLDEQGFLTELRAKFSRAAGKPLRFTRVSRQEVPLSEAVSSYLFNSQLVTLPSGEIALIAPIESEESKIVHSYLKSTTGSKESGISQVKFVDLRESMLNGGGPACLRLRVALTEEELASVHPGVILDDSLFKSLENWVEKNYRDRLAAEDLCDPAFVAEVEKALDELTRLLKLGSVYPFQK